MRRRIEDRPWRSEATHAPNRARRRRKPRTPLRHRFKVRVSRSPEMSRQEWRCNMNWDAVQTEAMKKGWLIFAMDQGQTDVIHMPGPWGTAALGYCLGCTVRWIVLRYGGSDYAYDSKTRVVEMPDWRTTRDQNIYEDTPTLGDFPDELVPVYAQYGLTVNKGQVTTRNSVATGSMLRADGSAGTGCYHIVLSRDSGGRHGV